MFYRKNAYDGSMKNKCFYFALVVLNTGNEPFILRSVYEK